jgi:hypothetical protein
MRIGLEADVAKEFLQRVVAQASSGGLTSDEHFTVDGTLLEAWASLKSFQPKNQKGGTPPDDRGNPTVDFHGERRSNDTHASKTDADAKLARKGPGKEAKLSYSGNLLVENRNGLIVNAELLEANGRAERDAALLMLEQVPGTKRVTTGADKGYDTAEFVAECRHMGVTPHVARNTSRRGGSAIDARTVRHPGYAVSQRRRKRIEECFGWLKDIALLRKLNIAVCSGWGGSSPSLQLPTTWCEYAICGRSLLRPHAAGSVAWPGQTIWPEPLKSRVFRSSQNRKHPLLGEELTQKLSFSAAC